jgi:hypothetical protein
VVAPRWAGACVEEDTDDCQIEFSPGAGSAIGPFGLAGDSGPTIIPIHDEVPPARMKGYFEERIRFARHFQYQVDGTVHAIEVDAEIREPVVKADREHSMRAFADRFGTQQ